MKKNKYKIRVIKKKFKKMIKIVQDNYEQLEKDYTYYDTCGAHPILDNVIEQFNKIDPAITTLYFDGYRDHVDSTYADLLVLFGDMSYTSFDFCTFGLYQTLNGYDVPVKSID